MPEVFVEKLGWILLHSLWQGGLIALLTAGLLWGLRRSSSHLRYIVCFSSLVLILLVPVLTVLSAGTPALGGLGDPALAGPVGSETGRLPLTAHSAGKFRQLARPESLIERTVRLLDQSLPLVTRCWAVGLGLLCLWHGGGAWRVRRWLRAGCGSPSPALERRWRALAREVGLRGTIRFRQSGRLTVPVVVGVFRPVVLVPVALINGLDPDALEAIIVHELVHIRRYDYLMNAVQMVIETLLFYHPAVWWLSRRVRQEREHCCDDLAVCHLGDELLYVKSLVRVEEHRHFGRLAVAATDGDLFERIWRLTRGGPQPTGLNGANPMVLTAVCLLSLSLLVQPVLARSTWVERLLFEGRDLPVRLEEGLVAHYPLDGTAIDTSGNGNHGELQGGVQAGTDRFGRARSALDFDGLDDRIRVAASDSLNVRGSLSVSCWVKPRRKTYYQAWVSKANDADSHSQWRIGSGQFYGSEWGLTQYTRVGAGEANYQDFWVTACGIPVGRWTHVVAVVDQVRRQCRLYVGGREVACFGGVLPFTVSDDPLYIAFQLDNYCYFDGLIDDLRIYRRPLNPREVWALATSAE